MATKIPVKYIDTTKYTVDITVDDSYMTLADYTDAYEIIHFTRNYLSDNVKDYIDDNGQPLKDTTKMLKSGKAFLIDMYEHGNAIFTLAGTGMNCRWDTSRNAGLIILADDIIDGITKKQREQYARDYLKQYTDYFNGEIYNVNITDERGKYIDSICCIIGTDYITDVVKDMIPDAIADNVTFTYDGEKIDWIKYE
jgi:hypothetical protein